MFSYEFGVPIAVNTKTNKIIRLNLDEQNTKLKFSKEFLKKIKKLKPSEIKNLVKHLQLNEIPEDVKMKKWYELARKDIEDNKQFKCLELGKMDGKLEPIPRADVVEKLNCCGVSGSGKSTYCSKWLEKFKKDKQFKKQSIYIFSSVKSDKCFDKVSPEYIPIDDSLIDDPLDVELDLSESLIIFDDCDTLPKQYKRAVYELRDHILECGRHYNCRTIITNHLISDYKNTRKVLNECTSITLFPKASGRYHIDLYLKNYMGMDKIQIDKVHKLNSRWITLYRTYPNYILYERGICFVSDF